MSLSAGWIGAIAVIGAAVAATWLVGARRWTRRARVRANWVVFVRSAVSILRHAEPNAQPDQLMRLYERYVASQVERQQAYRSLPSELWTIVGSFDHRTEASFRRRYGVTVTAAERTRLVELVELFEERQPYAQLPAPWSTHLRNIREGFDRANAALGLKALDDLADALSQRQEVAFEMEKRQQRRSTLFQWAGIVLTVVTFAVGTLLTIAAMR